MPVRRERIAAALLNVVALGCPANVERNRRASIDVSEVAGRPHVNIIDGGHTADYSSEGDVGYTARFDVEGAVSAYTDADLGPAVNDLYGQVIAAVMADISLGGECEQIREASFDLRIAPVAESIGPFADFSVGLEIDFRCPDGNPSG